MKSTNYFKLYRFYWIIFGFSASCFGQNSAVYTFSFASTWKAIDHSDNGNIPLPSNAHWSDLVGATHNASVSFFQNGTMASPGIEAVAEVGVNTIFNTEVTDAINNGNANQWLQQAFSPFAAISTATLNNITVSKEFPFLTLVSMIAPSPDWFIGVNSFSLLDDDNNWKNSVVLDIFGFDAGTEDGNDYSTSNSASNPQVAIQSLINIAPFNGQKLGTLSITLNSILGIDKVPLGKLLAIYPNPIKNKFSIQNSSTNKIVSIQVFDMLGKLVYSEVNPITVDISMLQNGIYLAKLVAIDNTVVVKKLIKK